MKSHTRRLVIAAAASFVLAGHAIAQDRSIVVASTTSTQDSGLFGHILPMFKAKTGIDVKVVAQGTGQALDTARRGDADVVFVHARPAEEKFLAEGFGVVVRLSEAEAPFFCRGYRYRTPIRACLNSKKLVLN